MCIGLLCLMKYIELSKNGTKNKGKHKAIVDDDWYDYLNKWNWSVHIYPTVIYAERDIRVNGKKNKLRMHNVVYGQVSEGYEVDHENGNGLDNRKGNLRKATRSQNNANRHAVNGNSKFKGVHYCNRTDIKKRYRVKVEKDGIIHNVGYFETEIEAAIAYNKKALELFGKFAHLNKITEPNQLELFV